MPVAKKKKRVKRVRYTDPPDSIGAQDLLAGETLATSAFVLREDGSIATPPASKRSKAKPSAVPRLAHRDDANGVWLYHGNCLELLDAIAEKYPEGRFDCIFADPPYFLSNGGITCHAGKMVKVDKGDWDKSRGPEVNHEFNLEWLRRCQRVLKPNGTLWVSGTHHIIFSVGYAMQQLGFKILNDIAWEKPNPPPNLSCRYFTHSTETILWAAKNEKSKHCFNYPLMRETNGGKQMKTVWTMTAPGKAEKTHGKHPTQKPIALIERCILASTQEGDFVLDPFLGGGTTAVVAVGSNRKFVGVELESTYLDLAMSRTNGIIVELLLRIIRIETRFEVTSINDLDLFGGSMDRIALVSDKQPPQSDCIFHETKFVFLSCVKVSEASVVHTTVETSLQEAWSHASNGKKRATTHIIRCETEILRVKSVDGGSD